MEGRQLLSAGGESVVAPFVDPALPVAAEVPAAGPAAPVAGKPRLNSAVKLKRSPLVMETIVPVRDMPVGPMIPADSTPVQSTPTLRAPLVMSSAYDYDSATVFWGDVQNEQAYHVLRSTDGVNFTQVGTVPANMNVYTDATVSSGTSYQYKVVAVAPGYLSGTSAATAVATPAALVTEFGGGGLTRLSYKGKTLVDTAAHPEDAFEVAAVKLTYADGSSQVLQGKAGVTRSVDVANRTVTWGYAWGRVSAKYVHDGDRLNVIVTVHNDSPHTVAGVDVFPLAVRFDQFPAGWTGNEPHVGFNSDGPTVITADLGDDDVMVLANENVAREMYVGWMTDVNTVNTRRFGLLVGSTPLDYQPLNWPRFDQPVPPGSSDTHTISLRFGKKQQAQEIAKDVYEDAKEEYPPLLNWTDRRGIGTVHLASHYEGHRSATNPRGFLNDPTIDVFTTAGLERFRSMVLRSADDTIAILRDMNAQGAIVWDAEGQEYPHDISYIGDPRLVGQLAPEMEYRGTVDEYFRKFRDAGLRVGVTIRAQRFVRDAADGSVAQVHVQDVQTELAAKIAYARDRWGVTMFYIDSNVDGNLTVLDANVMKALIEQFPDVLLIPEHETPKYYGYTAPYDELRAADTGTAPEVRQFAPDGFSVIYTGGGDLSANFDTLVQSVRGGDVLLFESWFRNPSLPIIQQIYAAAELQ